MTLYKHGAYTEIAGDASYYAEHKPVRPDHDPNMEQFVPDGYTALITKDGAVFYCRKEND